MKRARAQLGLHGPPQEGILRGRSQEVLRWFPEASIDAVVTDPPYELGFMGKKWDATGIACSVALWREVLRVLKPGGHLLAFGGTRTYHRTACAIEDAGFEIRDSLHWMYGTGFPKSLNVSKAIDDAAGAERQVVGAGPFAGRRPRSDKATQGVNFADDAYVRPAGHSITAPATEAARQWDGWGTALKPAHEPIVLARKPLEGTVAANVQAHGTGGLNIGACRIGAGTPKPVRGATENTGEGLFEMGSRSPMPDSTEGRWPANVLLDEAAAAELDAQSGDRRSGTRSAKAIANSPGWGTIGTQMGEVYGDSGGASRFFYVAKPSRKERDLGCARNAHPTVKPVALMRWLVRLVTPPQGLVLDPFAGSGTTAVAAALEGCRFTAIEQDADYCELARRRVAHWAGLEREASP